MESKIQILMQQMQEITYKINEGFNEFNIDGIFLDVCAVVDGLNKNYQDLENIISLGTINLTKKETDDKKQALNQAILEFQPNKINILLVFGAFDKLFLPHSNILIEFNGEFYSIDTIPELNSVVNLLSEQVSNNLFVNGVKNTYFQKMQKVTNTCIEKSLLIIDNILQIFREIQTIENKDFIKNFLRNGLTEKNQKSTEDQEYTESCQMTSIDRFDFNSMQSLLVTDHSLVLYTLNDYLIKEKELLKTSKDLEEVRKKIDALTEKETVDRRLKKYYLQEFETNLQTLKNINNKMLELIGIKLTPSTNSFESCTLSNYQVSDVWSKEFILITNEQPKSKQLNNDSVKFNQLVTDVEESSSTTIVVTEENPKTQISFTNRSKLKSGCKKDIGYQID